MNQQQARQHRAPRRLNHVAAAVAVFALSVSPRHGDAAATDISNMPLATSEAVAAKPNLLFVLDNSGSMTWDYMPDDVYNQFAGGGDSPYNHYAYYTSQCNGVAYNPAYTYDPPVRYDGVVYPPASFTAAWSDGFKPSLVSNNWSTSSTSLTLTGTGTVTVTLAAAISVTVGSSVVAIVDNNDNTRWLYGTVQAWNSGTRQMTVTVRGNSSTVSGNSWSVGTLNSTSLNNRSYYTYNGTQKARDWTYTSSGAVNTSTTFYQECALLTSSGSSLFTRVTVTSASAEAQNYANWYSYYRTRRLMVRSAAGRAFQPLDSGYRIGFTVISDRTVTPSSVFLDVDDYDDTQRAAFFSRLYGAEGSSSTPLRGALSKAGRYYAKKVSSQTYDPQQYSCQRNFTLLSTDGYWNTGSESSSYGPDQLDGATNVAQQDAWEDRPMYDGATRIESRVTPYTQNGYQTLSTQTTTYYTYTRNSYSLSSSGCSGGRRRLVTQPQIGRAQKFITTQADQQRRVGSYTVSVTTTGGVTGSPVTSGTTWSGWTTTSTNSSTGATSAAPANPATGATWSNNGSATQTSCSSSAALPSPNPSTPVQGSDTSAVTSGPTTSGSYNDVAVAGEAYVTRSSTGGSTDSLADVAEFYYVTDLRTSDLSNCTGALGRDVCSNNVPGGGTDNATTQHMTTYTMGFGLSGYVKYDKNYLSGASADYNAIVAGTKDWPIPITGTDNALKIDDLWHAAVNGRGKYFATTNADEVSQAINGVLSSVAAVRGSSSAAATSSLNPVSGIGEVYVGIYKTKEWVGDLQAFTLDAANGTISTTANWGAQGKIDNQSARGIASDTRKIYYLKPGSTTLQNFNYTNLTADGLGGYFQNFCSQGSTPDQCSTLTGTQLTAANNGTNLVNYLRGADAHEGLGTSQAGYRTRTHAMGDVINATPVFAAKPPFSYTDTGYSTFVADNASRPRVVYVAANDGMLHAISAETSTGGQELWAYVPRMVMQNMYMLADSGYETKHRYFVDGAPVVADVKIAGQWKTLLVGGLNAGGKGYYALDVTDPLNPKGLWEFTDANMGLSYGNPIVTKRANGSWVVIVSSGYNNTSGDGNGHLFVLDAATGTKLMDIPTYTSGTTPAGTPTSPSGLGKISGWATSSADNTVQRVYGGDLKGNVWRFDIDSRVAPNQSALLLGKLQVNATTPQPITTSPKLVTIESGTTSYPVVVVATGRYLGTTDIEDSTQQSVYAIKDRLTATGWGDVRANGTLVSQTLTTVTSGTTQSRTVTNHPVDWANSVGWKVDLPSSRERVVVDMLVYYTDLIFASAIPGTSECSPSGGDGWRYQLALANGGAPNGSDTASVGTYLGNHLVAGLSLVYRGGKSTDDGSGSGTDDGSGSGSGGSGGGGETPTPDKDCDQLVQSNTDTTVDIYGLCKKQSSSGKMHRTSWRELAH